MVSSPDVPSVVVGVDPTNWAGLLIEGLGTIEGRKLAHPVLRTSDELQGLLQRPDLASPAQYVTVLVNVEALSLADLEEVLSAVDASCLVVALHRRELDPDRAEWAVRAGGLTLQAGLTREADIGSLSRIAYGRPVRRPLAEGMLVFLCHASEDRAQVRELYRRLTDEGVPCWLDREELRGGQQWESEIRAVLRRSSLVLVCLSERATAKTGFVQKELRWALDEATRQPHGRAFLVPVRLQRCDVPEPLQAWQHVDLYKPDGYARLLKALRAAGVSTP